MPVYEWTGDSAFRDNRNDRTIQPGEQVELSEDIAEGHREFRAVEQDTADESGGLPDPSEYSVSEFFTEYSLEDFSDEERSELAAMEADGKDRESMLDRLTP